MQLGKADVFFFRFADLLGFVIRKKQNIKQRSFSFNLLKVSVAPGVAHKKQQTERSFSTCPFSLSRAGGAFKTYPGDGFLRHP